MRCFFIKLASPISVSGNKTRFLSASTLPNSNLNQLLKTISKQGSLRQHEKAAFIEYWRRVADEFPNARTIFQEANPVVLANFVKNNKKNSSTVRGFYRREVIFNKNSLPMIRSLLDDNTSTDALTFCIQDSLSTKDILIAADLFLLYYKLYTDRSLRHDLASEIISAISFQNPKYDNLQLIKYLQLVNLFKQRKEKLTLTPIQTTKICSKALSLDNDPILTKQVLVEVMYNSASSDFTSRSESINAAYDLIHTDFKARNAAGVFFTWMKISNNYSSLADHDPRILYIVMKTCVNNNIYRRACKDIISRLPPQFYSNNPLILPVIIDYVTKRGSLALAEQVMNNVNGHILPENAQNVLYSRRCLSSLLKMHLKFNDSQGVDRVLKQINDIFGAYSQENFQAIASHLLKENTLDNIVKAVNMVSKIPQNKALLAYSSIINSIVDWQIASNGQFDNKSMHIIDELLTKAHKQDPYHKSSLWIILASLYIKKIVHYKNFKKNKSLNIDTSNLDLAKLIFLKSDACKQLCHCNPFSQSSPQNTILKLTNKNKIIILRNIATSAVKGHRKDIFLWCCAELYKRGMPIKELIMDWHAMFNYQFRSVITKNKETLEKDLSINGLPFIKDALK